MADVIYGGLGLALMAMMGLYVVLLDRA